MFSTKNPFEVLGVPETATNDEVRARYLHLALKHHPDKVPPEQRSQATIKFVEIGEAYQRLASTARPDTAHTRTARTGTAHTGTSSNSTDATETWAPADDEPAPEATTPPREPYAQSEPFSRAGPPRQAKSERKRERRAEERRRRAEQPRPAPDPTWYEAPPERAPTPAPTHVGEEWSSELTEQKQWIAGHQLREQMEQQRERTELLRKLKDPYKVLRLDRDCGSPDVWAALKRWSHLYAMDLKEMTDPDSPSRGKHRTFIEEIREAYLLLVDENMRDMYDRATRNRPY